MIIVGRNKGSQRMKIRGVISKSILFRLVVCLAVCSVCVSGCKRRQQDYAGIPDPNRGEIIDPHK